MLERQRHGLFPLFGRVMVATFLLCWQAAAVPALAGSVGFATVRADDPPGEKLKVEIWYPTRAAVAEHDVGLFTQVVAPDGAVAGQGLPLIVVSHGSGGSAEEHYDTALALAQAGFVVAAVQHTGDNYQDHSRATAIADRAPQMKAVTDFMLTKWVGHAAIDPKRIGVFGFSAGAFTALVLVGGVPDLTRIGPYCAGHPDTFVCNLVRAHPADPPPPGGLVWVADPRIKAAVVAAPAIGFTFSKAGLAGVKVPVQLWRAERDHILPSPDYVEPVLDGLPVKPEYHVAVGADHFDFLAPCSDALAHVAPEICQETGGFDRSAFHRSFNAVVVAFFERTLRK